MTALEKARLRKTLRKLKAIEAMLDGTIDRDEAAEDMLDLLAVQSGLKPVFLLGRGLDDPGWIERVLTLGRDLRLRAVEGPYWDATPWGDGIPGWYADDVLGRLAPLRAWYLCRSRRVEQSVRRVCDAGGRLTIAEEAALLGYPECCVAAHYRRALAYHGAVLSILRRQGGGDEGRMQSLMRDGSPLAPETDAEKSAFDTAMAVKPAPHGSWNMCESCTDRDDSPSADLSRRYRAVAMTAAPGSGAFHI